MATTTGAYVPVCANCQNPGNAACKGCLLVTYCSKDCQIAHWNVHKRDCKSPLKEPTWRPQWMQDRRQPDFEGNLLPPYLGFGTVKYLWGNVPSIDVLQLGENEGATYSSDLSLLFAASGDLRHVVKTVSSLPQSYNKNLSIVINDIDFDVVARNTIMLLLALTISNEAEAAETVLHFWYSALVRPVDMQHLQSLRPLIEDVCLKIVDRKAGSLQAKTFTFGMSSIRIVLKKEAWTDLLNALSVPKGLSVQRAHNIRVAVTKAPSRIDFRHRDLMFKQPAHRICKERFREDGILVPFSFSREDFSIPNPTIYQAMTWPMMDDAEPLSGWDLAEVLQTSTGTAINDLYGKLFVHVRSVLISFKRRLSSSGARFELYNSNATELPQIFAPNTFARIEASNICDEYCLGPETTVGLLSPLLQKVSKNPHATLVTLFMNAVKETGDQNPSFLPTEAKALMRFKAMQEMVRMGPQHATLAMMAAMPLGQDVERTFAQYVEENELIDLFYTVGMKIKDRHTIVEKWPMRLKLRPDQLGAEEEFAILLSTDCSHTERYVEWNRMT